MAVPTTLVDSARQLFGGRLQIAEAYADLLSTDGIVRGLIGPRETPRLWDRHLLNCAALAALVQPDAEVTDVGSGAGLPGIVLAIARPDLAVTLVEPLARRTAFLEEAVESLGLDRVQVVRARAEESAGKLPPADVVTARAVASIDRLAAWCLPLAKIGGRLLAMKGASAEAEIVEHADAVRRAGGADPVVRRCGDELLEQPTTVIEVVRERDVMAGRRSKRRRR